MKRILIFILLLVSIVGNSQKVIDIINDTSRNYNGKINSAEAHLKRVGKGRGTGNKQFERWKYENKFRVQSDGYLQPVTYDQTTYEASTTPEVNVGSWEELGPKSWNRTTSWNPGVGRITGIAVHPLNTNLIYVTSPGGGVWKSINAGSTWSPLTDGNGLWMNATSVSVDPTNLNIVYVGTSANVIIKSLDAGVTWTQVNFGQTGTIKKILIDKNNTNNVFVTAGNGLWKSTNGASSWVRVIVGSVEDIEFHPTNSNIIYCSGSLLYRSIDAGVTWTQLTATEGFPNTNRALIAVSDAAPNNVYVVQSNGNEFGGLYVSTNSGASFAKTISGSPTTCTNFFGYETSGCGTGGQAGYDMALTISQTNPNDIYIGGINIWRSIDGGLSFTPQTQWSLPLSGSYQYTHADIHVLDIIGGILYVGSDGGIYKKSGSTFVDLSAGLGIRQFYRASIFNNKYIGGGQDNGTSFKTSSWYDWLGADGMDNVFINDNTLIGTSQYGSLYRTSDGGQTYIGLSKPSSGEWVTPLVYDNNKLYAGWNGIYFSLDLGSSWTKITSPITTTLTCLAVKDNYIYASRGTSLYVSSDNGATWTTFTTPASVNDIQISHSNPTEVYVVCNSTYNVVLKSTNAGVTFTNISTGLPTIIGRTLQMNNNILYLGLNIGVYKYESDVWSEITTNLPLSPINDLDVSGGYLYAATYGRGLWRVQIGAPDPIPPYITPTISGTGTGTASHTISWDVQTNEALTSVDVQQSTSGGSTYTTVFSSVAPSGNTVLTSRAIDATYLYRAYAHTATLNTYSPTTTLTGPPSVITYYLNTPTLTGSRNNKNLHTLNWSFTTNDVITNVSLKQSLDGITYNQVYVAPLTTSGTYKIQTSASRTYRYRLDVNTTNFTKSSNIVILKNGRKN